LKLCVPEALVRLQLVPADVLTAADDGIRCGKRLEFVAQSKCLGEFFPEVVPRVASMEKGLILAWESRGAKARDLALDQSAIDPADACRLPRTKHILDRRFLVPIHRHKAVAQSATQQLREFDVGHKAKSASEIVTLLSPLTPAIGERYGFHVSVASRADQPTAAMIGHCK
jgi:hypothetical protein